MARLGLKLCSFQGGMVAFMCPGCRMMHQVGVGEGPGPRWGYNGNPDAPTFSPSIKVKGTERLTDQQHAAIMRGEPFEPATLLCHSFVREGRIQFLNDCSHALAGQTVDLPDIDLP
ncbi:ammonia monooxygenase [Salipiger pacificus]|nr:ammonia monooxygenase [Alloyangia pacifica]